MSFTGHVPRTPAYRGMLLALFASGVATFSQLYAVQGLLPVISDYFQISSSQAALAVSSATLGLALAVTPWAIISDRIGRRKVICAALIASVLLGLLSTQSPNFETLVAIRFFEGLALAGVPGSALAFLVDEVNPKAVAVASGTYISGTTLGGLAGRLVASFIGEPAGWRWGIAAVSIMAGLATLFFLLKAPPARGFAPIRGQNLKGIAAKFGRALRGKMALVYAQGFLLMGGFVAVYNYLAFRLEAPPYLIPSSLAALVFLAYLSGTYTSVASGKVVAKIGRRNTLRLSILLSALGLALTLAGNLIVIVVGLLIFTAGFLQRTRWPAAGFLSWLRTLGPKHPACTTCSTTLVHRCSDGSSVFRSCTWAGAALSSASSRCRRWPCFWRPSYPSGIHPWVRPSFSAIPSGRALPRIVLPAGHEW
ncbi:MULTISPECIES: MFS transporter [unclassified Glutamicibacter]|uniref:MFS transporter n=1 Tax=unclassified Glutamicibacter TaxID=2627139 RepID=UPI0021CA95F0|nr:MFS transporter [Glutamicibacter sp. M10]UXN32751.1 MFS transporter [Glutamicibacter sp. M10]